MTCAQTGELQVLHGQDVYRFIARMYAGYVEGMTGLAELRAKVAKGYHIQVCVHGPVMEIGVADYDFAGPARPAAFSLECVLRIILEGKVPYPWE
jgi:hypothetical protein